MFDLDDRPVAFASDQSDPGRLRGRGRPPQPIGEDALKPPGRKGRVPRYLDAEVAGARGVVTGRGR